MSDIDDFDYGEFFDGLAEHNVHLVKVEFDGYMMEEDRDCWRFEWKKAPTIVVLDVNGNELDVTRDPIEEFCEKELKDRLSWGRDWQGYDDGDKASGTIEINVAARTVSISGTRQHWVAVQRTEEIKHTLTA
jgi:hypothetical protein